MINIAGIDYPLNSQRGLSRALSLVENEAHDYLSILQSLNFTDSPPLIGITGAPGAGKSTLVNALIDNLLQNNKRIGVLAVDPTSPFNYGSLLGDRIRLAEHFNNEQVFIRSIATRGSLGGLSQKTMELADVMRCGGFDYIFIETVGVGQSEVEIAALADITIVVLVPEGGDEVQALKSGLMEIADIFVVNKADRPGSASFINGLRKLLPQRSHDYDSIPIIPTEAHNKKGIDLLVDAIHFKLQTPQHNDKRIHLLVEKLWQRMVKERMHDVDKESLFKTIKSNYEENKNLNPYILKV